jgi:phosphoglycolate phosphatase
MQAAGVSVSATLAIGDDVRDAVAAKAVGIDFAGVAWGYATVQALRKTGPVTIFAEVSEIPEWLCRRSQMRDITRGQS